MLKINKLNNKRLYYVTALIAGALLPLAFAPHNFYQLSFLSCAALLWLWLRNDAKSAFWIGWLYGIGQFGVGVSWVYISIHRYGNASSIGASLITAALIMALALFPAVYGYLFNKFFQKNNWKKTLLVFPAGIVVFEWLRTFVGTGFPWLLLGYSQMATPLRHLAPIFGIYGVSWAVAFTAAAIITLIYYKKLSQRLIISTLLLCLWFGTILLGHVNWVTKTSKKPIPVSLIQGDIPQRFKWQPRQLPAILDKHLNLTLKSGDSQIIIWPEAAIPTIAENIPNFVNKLDNLAKQKHFALISGIPYLDQTANQYYNAITTFGNQRNLYLKRHLVPFGEYTPFVETLFAPLMNYLNIPMSNFTKGPTTQPDFKVLNYIVAPSLCYEIAYPELTLNHMPQADFLITISDDSWFGESWADAQQLQMGQMRSLEVGRYQLVATNNGITAILNQRGKIVTKAPEFTTFVLNGNLEIYKGKTAWVSWGHYLWLPLALLLVALGI